MGRSKAWGDTASAVANACAKASISAAAAPLSTSRSSSTRPWRGQPKGRAHWQRTRSRGLDVHQLRECGLSYAEVNPRLDTRANA